MGEKHGAQPISVPGEEGRPSAKNRSEEKKQWFRQTVSNLARQERRAAWGKKKKKKKIPVITRVKPGVRGGGGGTSSLEGEKPKIPRVAVGARAEHGLLPRNLRRESSPRL